MNARKPLTMLMAVVVLCLAAFTAAGCGDDNESSTAATTAETGTMTDSMDIVATASDTADLSTLVKLVTAAGLVETLQGEGPFTVFAPDNAAFDKVDAQTLKDLQDPANKEQLKAVLTYHVVAGEYTAEDIVKLAGEGKKLKTVQGEDLTPEVDGETVTLKDANGNTATVVKADVMTSNGVVHVIDGVLLPKS